MAGLDYKRLAEQSKRIIARFGREMDLVVKNTTDGDPTFSYNPITGEYEDQHMGTLDETKTVKVIGAVLPMPTYGPAVRFSQDTVEKSSNMIVMSATELTAAMAGQEGLQMDVHDVLRFGGEDHTIIEIIPIEPSGVTVIYEIGVARA